MCWMLDVAEGNTVSFSCLIKRKAQLCHGRYQCDVTEYSEGCYDCTLSFLIIISVPCCVFTVDPMTSFLRPQSLS